MASDLGPKNSYYAPFEKAMSRVSKPIDRFLHAETTSSIILILCTIAALLFANTALSHHYEHFFHTHISFHIGSYVISHTLHHWINDLLMALFFFVVGLEIKREVLMGELSDAKAAFLPVAAAIGGMVFPAGIYWLINGAGPGASGWGIPMATDIAFAVGVLMLLGDRIPKSLVTFLLALAIVDDLGAVVVIAIFYTENLNLLALGAVGVFLVAMIGLNLLGVRKVAPWLILALGMWVAMFESGVHATVAGVLAAWCIPGKPKVKASHFSASMRAMLDRFDRSYKGDNNLTNNDMQRAIVDTMQEGIGKVQSPLQRLESSFHVVVAFFILPLFALANAGVPISLGAITDVFSDPIPFGIIMGLVVGKLIGITGVSLLLVKLGIGQLPAGCTPSHMVGVGFMGGIGFTMSIFIAELGFRSSPELLVEAKMGVLVASLIAGIGGYLWFIFTAKKSA
jgi:NhaA family Na+:H+ antiporter